MDLFFSKLKDVNSDLFTNKLYITLFYQKTASIKRRLLEIHCWAPQFKAYYNYGK